MYEAYLAQGDALWPWRTLARASVPSLLDSTFGAPGRTARRLAASCRTLVLAEITHARPDWAIESVVVDGIEHPVVEEVTAQTPFATLRRFRKVGAAEQPRVLVAAPMSGHFATLLRDTVRTLLRDHDVHVTDWHNVRDVPLSAGRFGLDEYIDHMIEFTAALGPGANRRIEHERRVAVEDAALQVQAQAAAAGERDALAGQRHRSPLAGRRVERRHRQPAKAGARRGIAKQDVRARGHRGELLWPRRRRGLRRPRVALLHAHEQARRERDRRGGALVRHERAAGIGNAKTRADRAPRSGRDRNEDEQVAEVKAVGAVRPVRFGGGVKDLAPWQQPRFRRLVKRVDHALHDKQHDERPHRVTHHRLMQSARGNRAEPRDRDRRGDAGRE